MRSSPKKQFLRSVADSLERVGVPRDAIVLAAVSGGPDSVAMLHALLSLRERFEYRVIAAHLNHRIRGAESDRDEAFVRELCARLEVELIAERAEGFSIDTPNLEEHARDARYTFLNAAADRMNADYIAVAHHADDQAETFMLRLLRGSGAAGLAAMGERGPGRLMRPMLSVTRAEVIAYLDSVRASFVIDSSNQSPTMLRNRIRSHLLPMLERDYAPGLSGRLAELTAEMRALDDFVRREAARNFSILSSADGFDLSGFGEFHPAIQAELIRQFIKADTGSIRRIERVHIEAVRQLCLEGPPNGALNLPGGIRIAREYGCLRVSKAAEQATSFVIKLAMEGATEIPDAGFIFNSTMHAGDQITVPQTKFEAIFDADAAEAGLTARSFRAGDSIAPLGMTGHRKVQDIFVDNKLPTGNRARFPIVELGGAIAWLPGIVRGRVGLVTEASDRVLRVKARSIDSTRPH